MRKLKRRFWEEAWRTARIASKHGFHVASSESEFILFPWRPGLEKFVAINWLGVGVAMNLLIIRELTKGV